MGEDLSVRRRTASGWDVVEVAGEVDLSNVDRIEEAVAGSSSLVVDLSLVSYIDSAGLGLLIETDREVRRTGGRLRLVIPPGHLAWRLLEVTGTATVIATYPELESALDHKDPTGG
jgi:anti-anti-sigma factor